MSINDELSQGVANGTTCICGKNSKDANRISCVAFRCPCCKHHPPCTRRRPCHTPFARKIEVKDQLLVEGVDVVAHANRKLTQLVRCRAETESESQCPCIAGGIGCTKVCLRFNCGNIVCALVKSVTPMPLRKRK